MSSLKVTILSASSKYLSGKKVKIIRFLISLGSTPNIDFFTRDELKNLIRDFKSQVNDGKLDDLSRLSGLDTSTARMFDEAMNRRRSQSIMKRSQTMVAEDTILTRNFGSACIVTALNQYVTSSVGSYVRT
jgi:hypothetical protein